MIENFPAKITNWSKELVNLMKFINDVIVPNYPTKNINLYYLVSGIMSLRECDAYKLLKQNMSSYKFGQIQDGFDKKLSQDAINAVRPGTPNSLDENFRKLLNEYGNEEMKAVGDDNLTSAHLLLALLNRDFPGVKIKSVFNEAGITYTMLLAKMTSDTPLSVAEIIEDIPENSSEFTATSTFVIPDGITFQTFLPDEMKQMMSNMISSQNPLIQQMNLGNTKQKKNSKTGTISKYCTNINNLAISGKIDKIVGRERETEEIIRILGRRKKNNAILLGGEGVGKTAIAENLAYKIVNNEVPPFLSGKQVVSLDMTALMAGTTLRGMFEERVQNIISEIKSDGGYILMIDNIGSVLSNNDKNEYDISAMLSNALENGELQVIGTADYKTFRSTFDKNPSLSRRFQKIVVEAPSISESLEIVDGVKKYYEKFHGVKYTDEAVRACVNLADRYITERNLPDSAIDIMDESGSYIGKRETPDEIHIKELNEILRGMTKDAEAIGDDDEHTASELKEKISDVGEEINTLNANAKRNRKKNPPVVDENTILEIVSKKTGIPVNKLTTNDKQRLLSMDERLKKEVIGQDEAIETICRSLKRNRIGFHQGGCMFSALMQGKTGVGKTLISKKLAKEMFGSEDALIRFDMSEYPDKSAVNKLIGSNPGYIGYEEGGQLTEAIKNKKHCVLLLDEIEKADPEVYNIFLQVLDEGFLTDNSGMKVDFKNVIVLFTSNVGTRAASEFGKGIGFNDNEDENSKRILLKELKKKFPPEFINRLDCVIYFNNLTDDNLRDVIRLEINKMVKNLNEIGYNATYDDDTVEYILQKIKPEREFGARPIMRAIRVEIEDKITDALLDNDYPQGQVFVITKENDNICISAKA